MARERFDNRVPQFAVGPIDANLESAPRAQSVHASISPRSWERRQHPNFACVALQEHLGDPRGQTEVAIDLEWGVRIEEVWV